jgi:type II secretory pathway pseudopilin PulG
MPANRELGFTYAVVLAAVVIVGILAQAAHLTTSRLQLAEREAELLFRGAAYQRAIASYFQANGRYPRSLSDLVKDPGAVHRRHLRTLYLDPMAAPRAEWNIVRSQDGGIGGVASASRERPMKQANFAPEFEKFAGAASYSDWVFEFDHTAPEHGKPKPGDVKKAEGTRRDDDKEGRRK